MITLRCACGAERCLPASLLGGAAAIPAGTANAWASACPTCAPGVAFFEWGWQLRSGVRLHCTAAG